MNIQVHFIISPENMFVPVRSFYDQHTYAALRAAENYGPVFTLPEFLEARMQNDDDALWLPYTVRTEEILGRNKSGKLISVIVHGTGLLTAERIERAQAMEKGLTQKPDSLFPASEVRKSPIERNQY